MRSVLNEYASICKLGCRNMWFLLMVGHHLFTYFQKFKTASNKCILCQSNENPDHRLVHIKCCCPDHVMIFEKVNSVLKILILIIYLNLVLIMHFTK